MDIKIVTFNIWDLPLWLIKDRRERVTAIASKIQELDVDIVCLQESFDYESRFRLQKLLGESYHHTIVGKGRQYRRFLNKKFDRTGGLVIFSKFPILKYQFKPFVHITSLNEWFARKGYLICELNTPAGVLGVINTHLHYKSIVSSTWTRLKQLAEIMRFIKKNRGAYPLLLAGDFNEPGLHYRAEFIKILEENNFNANITLADEERATYRVANKYTQLPINGPLKRSQQLDYIFTSGLDGYNWQLLDYRPLYLDPPLSDHDPVILKLHKSDKTLSTKILDSHPSKRIIEPWTPML